MVASLLLASALPSLASVSDFEPPPPSSAEPPAWVPLEIYARSATGEPVLDLSPEDLVVFEDGLAVETAGFEAIESGRRVEGKRWRMGDLATWIRRVPTALRERQQNLLIVYVDNAQLSAFHRNRLLSPLAEFLHQRLDLGDQVMVASFDGTFEVRQALTGEKRALDDTLIALTHVPVLDSGPYTRSLEGVRSLFDLRQIELARGQIGRGNCSPELLALARQHASRISAEVEQSMRALGRFVDSLAALPGRKSLLYLSDGLPRSPGLEAFELLKTFCARPGDLDRDAASFELAALYAELGRRANTSQVSVFPFEAAGPRLSYVGHVAGDTRAEAAALLEPLVRANLQAPLSSLAIETGGRAVLNTTDFRRAFVVVGEHLDTYYALSFQPRSDHPRGDRTLVVLTRRPGVQLEHRRSFEPHSRSERQANRTLGALLFGAEDNPLGVQVEVGAPTDLDGTIFSVPIRLRVPLGNLVLAKRGEGSRVGRLRLHLGTRGRGGAVAPLRSVEIPLSMPEKALVGASGKWYSYETKLLMRAGPHTVAVGLSDEVGLSASFLRRPIVLQHLPTGVRVLQKVN